MEQKIVAADLRSAVKAMQYNQMQNLQMDQQWKGSLGHWYYDVEEQRFFFNPLLGLALGMSLEAFELYYTHELLDQLMDEESIALLRGQIDQYLLDDSKAMEVVIPVKAIDGPIKHIFLAGRTMRDQWQLHFISGEMFDVSHQYNQKECLRNTVSSDENLIDGMTGVLNRQAYDEGLYHAMTRARAGQAEFSLLAIDLDFFHNINSHFGRHKGDEVLVEVSRILHRETRDSDRVYRYAGDQFHVILEDVAVKSSRMVAERIRKSIANHMFAGGIRITASGGLVHYDRESLNKLTDKVIGLVKNSKYQGHNRMTYEHK